MGLDPPAEDFLSKIVSAGRAFGAAISSDSIPQIPGLPLFGVFKTNSLGGGAYAVNAYLNKIRDQPDGGTVRRSVH